MENLQSTIEVIATAVEKDTDSLKQLLIRNGVMAANATKDQLQGMLTSALQTSETFRNEFRNWVIARSGVGSYLNADGADPTVNPFASLFPGPAGAVATGVNMGLGIQAGETPAAATTATGGGFFSGVTLNSLLDFAKTGLNNYTDIVKSKTDKAIVDAAVEKERLNQATSGTSISSDGTGKKWLYVVLGIMAVAGIAGGIYYYNKK